MLTRTQKVLFSCCALLCATLLAIAAKWDLSIANFLYQPESSFGIVMEAFCYWPIKLPWILLGAVLAALYKDQPLLRIPFEFFVLWYLKQITVSSVENLVFRGLLGEVNSRFLMIGIIFCAVLMLAGASKLSTRTLLRLRFIAIFGIVYKTIEIFLVDRVKLFWLRTRYDDLLAAGDFSDFTPWYQIAGHPGNTSFPSGHAANACGILLLLLLPILFCGLKKHRGLFSGICIAYIGFSCLSRLVIGRHFLSDTIVGVLISCTVFFVLLSLPFVKKQLQQLSCEPGTAP